MLENLAFLKEKPEAHFHPRTQFEGSRGQRKLEFGWGKVLRASASAGAASQRERRRLATGWADGRLPALPDPPSKAGSTSSFLHDTHDLFYYFYFSLIILLNGLFRSSMKLLKFPFRMLLAFTISCSVSFCHAKGVPSRSTFSLRCHCGLFFFTSSVILLIKLRLLLTHSRNVNKFTISTNTSGVVTLMAKIKINMSVFEKTLTLHVTTAITGKSLLLRILMYA